MFRSLNVSILLAIMCCIPAQAKELLSEGDFKYANAGSLPQGWDFPKSPFWRPSPNSDDICTVERVKTGSVLRIKNTNNHKGILLATGTLPLSGQKKLLVNVKYSLTNIKNGPQNWNTASVNIDFYEKENIKIERYDRLDFINNTDITSESKELVIPNNATSFSVRVGISLATGIFDVYSISIQDINVKDSYSLTYQKYWNEEPVVKTSETRSEVVLNGYWKFCPLDSYKKSKSWGYILVPGLWYNGHSWLKPAIGGIVAYPQDNGWDSKTLKSCFFAQYERQIYIPSEFQNRRILLELSHVCTDAEIYIDSNKIGNITWPSGEIDLTGIVTPDTVHTLQINVLAKSDREFIEDFNNYDGKKHKTQIYNRGISGNVLLKSIPFWMQISDPVITTSVQKKTITFEFSLSNAGKYAGKSVECNFVILDGKEQVEKEFSNKFTVGEKQTNSVSFTFSWENPRLWDFLQPNLYTARISAKFGTEYDQVCQRFGFREVRISGREILLNEKPFRARLTKPSSPRIGGMRSVLTHVMNNIINANFNLIQLSPHIDVYARGSVDFRSEWAGVADELGLPILMPAVNFSSFIPWGGLGNDAAFDDFGIAMKEDWRKLQNHPSILFLFSGFNRFSYFDDQNPLKLGNGARLNNYADNSYKKQAAMGNKIMSIMRDVDPSRPVLTHQSSSVGDMHLINMYLNLIPLQEREEWLSDWATHGDKPFMAVEFGCPVTLNMMRGREGGIGIAPLSEPLMTEFCAEYIGEDAYKTEGQDYRDAVKQHWKSAGKYHTWHAEPSIGQSVAYNQVLQLFIKNTWRSWRSWGMTGGINPWENASGWNNRIDGIMKTGPYMPYMKEPYVAEVSKRFYTCYDNSVITQTGKTLVKLNSPAIAWIAGGTDNFTTKNHNYNSSEEVEKQIVLINDYRDDVDYLLEVRAVCDGINIFSLDINGVVRSGENAFKPIRFNLPNVKTKQQCQIVLNGNIGDEQISDEFTLTVFPKTISDTTQVSLYDHSGETAAELKRMNIDYLLWNGNVNLKTKVLIVGKNMLGDNNLPVDKIKKLVEAGSNVIFLENRPDLIQEHLSYRVANQVSRRAWPVSTQINNAITSGFIPEDLRDWRGSGMLIPSKSAVELDKGTKCAYPKYGWHWSNLGSISSSMIEKPHCSSWTPLFEGEFAQAFSPLMEMKYGDGLVLLNTFDLIGRSNTDPVADDLLSRMIQYAGKYKTDHFHRRTYYIGDDRDFDFLKKIQVKIVRIDHMPPVNSLLIVGRDAHVDENKLNAFIYSGGKALVLARSFGRILGFDVIKGIYSKNTVLPDWDVCKGLSVSDLYLKVDMQCDLLRGAETALNGSLGRFCKGKGEAVILQIHPEMLTPETYDYYKYSSWRWTRVISQLIANMGGSFVADDKFFTRRTARTAIDPVQLPLIWKAEFERRISAYENNAKDQRIVDIGNCGEKSGWNTPGFDDSKWKTLEAGKYWELQGDYWEGANGVVWYRCKVKIPQEWKGKNLLLCLGKIDDMDVSYFNGIKIGSITDKNSSTYYSDKRNYVIYSDFIRYGEENTIAVRVFDNFGNAGLYSNPDDLRIAPISDSYGMDLYDVYVNGYSDDWQLGDNPYRYWRW